MNGTVKYILLFVLVLLLQSVIFNNIVLFGVATPMILVYFIIKMPAKVNILWVMTFAFFLGLSVDISANTLGMNALACVLTAFLRAPVMRLYFGYEEGNKNNSKGGEYGVGVGRGRAANFAKYAATMSAIYCTIIFVVQAFTLFSFWLLLAKIILSTLITFALIIAFDSIKISSGGKRL